MISKRFLYLAALLLAAQHSSAWAQNPNPQVHADKRAKVWTVDEMEGNTCGKEVETKHAHDAFWKLDTGYEFFIQQKGDVQHKLDPITASIDPEMKKPVFYPFNENKTHIAKHPCDIRTSFSDFPFTFAIEDLMDTDGTMSPHILIIVPAKVAGADEFYLLISSVRTKAQCKEIPWWHPIIKDSCYKMRQLTDMQPNVSIATFFQEVFNRMDDIRWALVPVRTKMHNGVIHGNL